MQFAPNEPTAIKLLLQEVSMKGVQEITGRLMLLRRSYALPSLVVLTLFTLSAGYFVISRSAQASISSADAQPGTARFSEDISIRKSGESALLNISEGRNVLATYSGPGELLSQLEAGTAEPLSLASADFDEDGTIDLVSGYRTLTGGMLTIHKGNPDSISPNSKEARRRKQEGKGVDSPFLSARAFDAPQAPRFLFAEDFTSDGHADVLLAESGSDRFFVLPGDGRGALGEAQVIEPGGPISTLAVGQFGTRDGLVDVIAGISSSSGSQLLIFTNADGLTKIEPERISIPFEATAIVTGLIDTDAYPDLAVAAGSELLIVRGRTASESDSPDEAELEPVIQRSFTTTLKSLAIGDFSGGNRKEIAVLSTDGTITLVGQQSRSISGKSKTTEVWQSDLTVRGLWSESTTLSTARISSTPEDNLLVVDSAAHRVTALSGLRNAASGTQPLTMSLDSDEAPRAVLPMRLNSDALSDLVVLKRDGLAVSMTTPQATILVTSGADSGQSTLRQAILTANASPGADNIVFRITSGPTIRPLSQLPTITEALTIDGFSNPQTGFVELDGSLADGMNGLVVTGGNTAIRGMVINRFDFDGILLQGSGGSRIESNNIGVDSTGLIRLSNGGDGVSVVNSANNVIGTSTGDGGGNLISGNKRFGVSLELGGSTGNLVRGNLIGTNAAGTGRLGNDRGGIFIGGSPASSGNDIGGTRSLGNTISANGGPGVQISDGAGGNQVLGNLIGIDAGAKGPLGNRASGVLIFSSSSNAIGGGDTGALGNIIAFNDQNGVTVTGNTSQRNGILSNSVFSNDGLGIDLGCNGVTPNDAGDTDTGPNALQNFPTFTAFNIVQQFAQTQVTVTGLPNTPVTIQFYSNSACGISGYGEGENLLATVRTNTGATGGVILTISNLFTAGQILTAVVTDGTSNTSEFSSCTIASAQTANLAIAQQTTAATVPTGGRATSTITITNAGPSAATNVVLHNMIPPGSSFFGANTTQGTILRLNTCGTVGAVLARVGNIAPGGSVVVNLSLNVLQAADTTLVNPATVTSSTLDTNLANNSSLASFAIEGGGVVILRWQQPVPTPGNPTPAPINLTATASIGPRLQALDLSPSDVPACTLTAINIYKSELSPVQTIPENLWKSVPPDQVETSIATAPGGSFYVITNLWLCGDQLIESGPSNQAGVPAGPVIDKFKVKTNKIKVIGGGFVSVAQVFIDGIGFSQAVNFKSSTLLVQKGQLSDGRSLSQAVPEGVTVTISVLNGTGGVSSLAFTK